MQNITVGLFPYGDVGNPYQLLIRKALAQQGVQAVAIPKSNFFPLFGAVRHPIDILQMYWPHSLFTGSSPLKTALKRAAFAVDITNLQKKKFIFSVENLYPHDSRNSKEDMAYTQKILMYTDGVIFTSESARQIYQSYYKLPSDTVQAVIPHIHYIDVYPNTVTRHEARQRLGIPTEKRVILALGRIHPYKGLHALIQAFLQESSPEDCLVIAGRAKAETIIAGLQHLIRTHQRKDAGEIKIIDRFIEDDELQYFYNASDAVAVTYDDMPINPGSIIMAMGFGKCIIAPEKGPIKELVHPAALFSYTEQEENSLAAALVTFRREIQSDEKGAQNRQRALERHSPEVAGKKFVDLYRHIL